MSRLNPKPTISFSHKKAWESSWSSLEAAVDPAITSKTLSIALEAQYAETHRLHHHLHRLVKSLPLPAFLYNRKGRVVTVNHEARLLMTQVDWKKAKWQVDDLWKSLVWPPVPFSHWEWKKGRLSCWDCPLGDPDQPSGLSIRYLKYETNPPREYSEPHLHRLAAIGEQTGRLAHDIRNPLSSIEWFATLLGRDDHPAMERRELADHLIQAIRSLDGLVSNLLLFSTPLQGQEQNVSISSLLDDVELLALYPLRKKRLTIHRHRESNLHEIKANESLLKQALLNLLLNAIHASQSDGRIDFHCRRTSSPQKDMARASDVNGITLSIRDEGCGMSEDELKDAFQPFFSKRKGGTGLGLPIVKDIVHIHQGMIHISSHQGKGTTVELFLPQ
jgi:two-component sensor histidine kinase